MTLAALASPPGPGLRRLLRRADPVTVPAQDRDDLVADYLPRLRRHVPVLSSDGSVALPEEPEPRLVLGVTWVAADEVKAAWTWRYRIGAADRVYALEETRGLRTVRRPEAEQAILDQLTLDDEQAYHLCRAHLRELGLEGSVTFRDTHAILFAEELLPGLRERVEVEEIGRQPDYREVEGTPVIHFATREASARDEGRTDWLDLEVEVSVDGTHLGLVQVLEALTKGMDRVILRNGVHVRIDRPEFARLAELVEAAAELRDQPAESVRLSHQDLHLWDELAEVGLVDEQAARWVQAAQALRSLESLPEVEPVGLKAELRSYQRDGFRWLAYLWQTGLGGILADDMGLGKTLQTLALVAYARELGAAPFLVVAPTSVVGTWAHEAAQFTPGLDVRVVTESQSRRGESVASLAAERRPRRHVVHAVPAGAGRLRPAVVGRAGARRGAVGQEPPRQDPSGGTTARRALPARADRHADGEPADGAVVAALDRGARASTRGRSASPRRSPSLSSDSGTATCSNASGSASGRSCCAAPRTWSRPTCRPSRSRSSRCR